MNRLFDFPRFTEQVYEAYQGTPSTENLAVFEAVNKFDSAAVMLFFTYPQMQEIYDQIDPEDVYTDNGFGLEKDPHVSLLVGLDKTVRPQQVIERIQQFPIPVMSLHNASMFPPRAASPFEVLKFDVKGAGLHEINRTLAAEFPYSNPFPYHPHCTIGFMKKGTAAKYVDMFQDIKAEARAEQLVYSKAGGKMIRIRLK